jgi:hypothetical protein
MISLRSSALVLLVLVAAGSCFEQSFNDTVFPPSGWATVNADSGVRNWQRLDIGCRTPPGCAYCGWEGYYLRNNDWLIAPQCSVVSGDRFSFWCRAQDDAWRESVEVWVSSSSPRPADFTRLDAFGTNAVSYAFHEYDLSPYAGQKVFLALVYRSWNQYGLLIDDVSGPTEWNPVHDVAIGSILSPAAYMRVGASFQPACRVHNLAQAAEWVRVSCEVEGFWRYDTGLQLAPGESATVTFPGLRLWEPDTYRLTFASHVGGDQRPWNDSAKLEFAVNPFQSRGGPDSLGYAWYDSDDPLGPVYNWQELAGAGQLLGSGDDTLFFLTLPWPVTLYGRDYSMCWVSTNGWLALGPPGPSNPADSNVSIPNRYSPNRLIAPFWDDLWVKSGEGNVWYQPFGDTMLVIEWRHVRRKGCDRGGLSFEAKLRAPGAIEFHYAGTDAGDSRYDGGMSATVGIEDAGGTVGLQYLFDGSPPGNLLSPGRAIRFLPMPPGVEEPAAALEHQPGLRVEPNPLRTCATISYQFAQAGNVQLKVYDAMGRVVRTLHDGPKKPGRYTATWDGTDNRGRSLANGIYFYSLNAPGYRDVKKAVVMR